MRSGPLNGGLAVSHIANTATKTRPAAAFPLLASKMKEILMPFPPYGAPGIAAGQLPGAPTSNASMEQLVQALRQSATPALNGTPSPNGPPAALNVMPSGEAVNAGEQPLQKLKDEPAAPGGSGGGGGGGGGGALSMPGAHPGADAYNKWLLSEGQRERSGPNVSTLEQVGRGAQLLSGFYNTRKSDNEIAQRQQALAQVVSGAKPASQYSPSAVPMQDAPVAQGVISKLMGW